MTAFKLLPHALLTAVPQTVSGKPAPSQIWRGLS